MLYLGIEIGGTKLQVGLGDGLGQVTHHHRVAAEPQAGGCRDSFADSHGLPASVPAGEAVGHHPSKAAAWTGGPVDDQTQQTIKTHQSVWLGFISFIEMGSRDLGNTQSDRQRC